MYVICHPEIAASFMKYLTDHEWFSDLLFLKSLCPDLLSFESSVYILSGNKGRVIVRFPVQRYRARLFKTNDVVS